ncbi:MAG: two-component regulator propeller domain-containing protein, partial [Pseudomonadota bacterium]|nr:two-component regulator propeller domain-containing protein [Pseudomonadota bacterium]
MWRAVKPTKRLIVFAIARLLLLLSGVCSFHAFGVVNLGIEQGLPQSSVGDIIQGPQGFMWFATNDGVARYDGSRFKTYQATSENQRPVKRFTQLLVSRDGVLFAMG